MLTKYPQGPHSSVTSGGRRGARTSSGQQAADASGPCQFRAGAAQGWRVSPMPLCRESCGDLGAIPFPSSFFLLNAPSRCALSFSLPASDDLLMAEQLWPTLPHRWGPLKHRPAWHPRFNPGSTQSPWEPKGLLKSRGVRGSSKEVPAGFPGSVSSRGCTRGTRGGSDSTSSAPSVC